MNPVVSLQVAMQNGSQEKVNRRSEVHIRFQVKLNEVSWRSTTV